MDLTQLKHMLTSLTIIQSKTLSFIYNTLLLQNCKFFKGRIKILVRVNWMIQ